MQRTSALLAALACASLLSLSLPDAARAAPASKDAPAKTSKPKQRAGTPKIIPSGSEESPRERERRLLRECKGRRNAGACAGYAS